MNDSISAICDGLEELPPPAETDAPARSLGGLPRRIKARITGFIHGAVKSDAALPARELERRLVEMGFVEGATVRIAHLGGLAGDPIGVLLDERRLVALRRQEAHFVAVQYPPEWTQ